MKANPQIVPSRPLLVAAGLSGALGIGLSAMSAHRPDLPNLGTAAAMLMFHAPAFAALSLMAGNRLRHFASLALAVGLILFAGDIATRAYLGTRLFPMAAPSGGMLMIAGWLGIAASAFWPAGRNR
ncbi:MAG: DUF423 domain-containing protein [Rhizobiaceae bacterium]